VTSSAARRDVWITAADGTQLYAIECGPVQGDGVPVLCLAGLTRNHRDFEPVIAAFGGSRRIIAPDYRGRGQSQHAADPLSYRPDVELNDAILLLNHLNIERVAVIGTSRGGIIGMIMANTVPERLSGLLLVDIGPVLAVDGLKRIASYVGRRCEFDSWRDAARHQAESSIGFEGVSLEQWERVARRIYGERNGRPCTEHDPKLAMTFPTLEVLDSPLPDLWNLIPALNSLPCGLIHGTGSSLLKPDTVSAMQVALPKLDVTRLAGRGHVPFLDEAQSTAAIARWLAAVDDHVRRVRVPG
jgi:pimeloyl-ACP methyl ester carboxylesterase